MKNSLSTKGFTLIELMLVIAIVSLLSSAFIFNGTEARKKAKDAKMAVESRQVETAITMYKEDNNSSVPYNVNVTGIYPLGKLYREGTNGYQEHLSRLVPKYLPQIPKSPNGNNYAYGISSDGKKAVFVANLNNRNRQGNNNNNNSCDFIFPNEDEENINYVEGNYTSCSASNYYTYQIPCIDTPTYDNESQDCFVTSEVVANPNYNPFMVIPGQPTNIVSNKLSLYCSPRCDGKSNFPAQVPDIVCATALYINTGGCNFNPTTQLNVFVCNLEQEEINTEDVLCDGQGENSEICKCIE